MAEDGAFSDAIYRDVHRLRPWRDPPGGLPALDRLLADGFRIAASLLRPSAKTAVVEVGGAGR